MTGALGEEMEFDVDEMNGTWIVGKDQKVSLEIKDMGVKGILGDNPTWNNLPT